MSTPTTPAPGSPQWLRNKAHMVAELNRPNAQGFLAAAERMEKLYAAVDGYIRQCAELSDEVQRLRAENEALRADKERLDWLLEHGAVGHFSAWRDAEGGKERTLFRLHSRDEIDAARKEGA